MTFLLFLIIGITIMVLFAIYRPSIKSTGPRKTPKEIMKEAQIPLHKLPKKERVDFINNVQTDLSRKRKEIQNKQLRK